MTAQRLLTATVALVLVAGCGYKGPLYLPDTKPQAPKPGGLATPDPAPQRPLPSEAAPTPK